MGIVLLSALASGQATNQAVNLTGSSYLLVQPATALVSPAGLTLEAWVFFDSAAPGWTIRYVASILDTYGLYIETNPNRIGVTVNTVGAGFVHYLLPAFGPLFPASSWHHLAMTYDNATIRVYLDALLIGQMAAGGQIIGPAASLHIGNVLDTYFFTGFLDEVRIWSYARSSSQLLATKNWQIGHTPGLVSSWRMNGDFLDGVGASNATPSGAVPFVTSTAPLTALLTAPATIPIGIPVAFQINTPNPGMPYAFDVSLTGTSPGIDLANTHIPLNGPYLQATYGASFPGVFSGFQGVLNATGHAFPVLNVPFLPPLVGQSVSACFVVLQSSTPLTLALVGTATSTALTAPAPIIDGVTPATGSESGGTALTISGTNFLASATVRLDGVLASNSVVQSGTTITCTTPPGAPGPTDVTVTNPDANMATAVGAFTYVQNLVLFVVSHQVALPGQTVTVLGSGFQAGFAVDVGGLPVVPQSINPWGFTFMVLAGVPCDTTISVANPDGQIATLPFNPSPTILNVTNATGPAAGGGTFWITGAGFFPATTVTVGGAPATLGGSSTFVTLEVIAPPGAPGPADVVISSAATCQAQSTYIYY